MVTFVDNRPIMVSEKYAPLLLRLRTWSSFLRDSDKLRLLPGTSDFLPVTRLRGGQPEQAPANGPQSLQFGVLRNLLNWSTSITNTSTSSANTSLDPERIKWLQEAMNSMLENTTDVFRQSIANLQDPEIDVESIERKERALEIIRDRVDHLDLAVGLDNMGGLKPTVACLNSTHSSIRWRAADVIAVAVINHDKLQQVGVDCKAPCFFAPFLAACMLLC
jgi:hypothetical protein